MPKKRTDADLTIHHGRYRSFEWYWNERDAMPALDAFERLSTREQNDFIASLEHWGDLPPGVRPLETRINEEHKDPLVVAIKAGKHRFTAFREESGPTWIVGGHYLKEGTKRDRSGDRVVDQTLEHRTRYFERVERGTYYERS